MEKQLTAQELNEKKWKDHWEEMTSYIQSRIEGCSYVKDTFSLGICKDGIFCQVRGADKVFKFDNNGRMFVKAINRRSGNFVKVYECLISDRTYKRLSPSHIIHKQYSEKELIFLQDIKNVVLDFYRPNSIKFITDNF